MIQGHAGAEIYCDTTTHGRKYLEAFPKSDQVRLSDHNEHEQDQKWFIEDGKFLGCNTKNQGAQYVEAMPKSSAVKLHCKSGSESDQWWVLKPKCD